MKILTLSGKNRILPVGDDGKVAYQKQSPADTARQACEVFLACPTEFSCKRAIRALVELEAANDWRVEDR
jgi:hypothetical protein